MSANAPRFASRATAAHRVPGWALGVVPGTVAALLLGYLVTTQAGPLIVGAAVLAALPIVAAHTRWSLTVALLPIFLVPLNAMEISHLGRIPVGLVAPLWVCYCVCILWLAGEWEPGSRRVWSALLLLAVFGIAGAVVSPFGSVTKSLSVIALWGGSAAVGQLAARNPRLLHGLALAVLPLAVLAVWEATGGPNPFRPLYGSLRFGNNEVAGVTRASATFAHPVVAGAVFATLGVMSVARGRPGWLPAAILFAGAAATISRSAAVGVAVGVGVMLLVQRGFARGRSLVVVAVMLAIIVAAIGQSSEFRDSVTNRVFTRQEVQVARVTGPQRVSRDLADAPASLVFGDGLQGTQRRLSDEGGLGGVSTYDNQYVTLVYDVGFPTMVLAVGLLLFGCWRVPQIAPPLLALSAVLIFFDGLYWPATACLFFVLCAAAARTQRQGDVARD
jgi:hypothetical protein